MRVLTKDVYDAAPREACGLIHWRELEGFACPICQKRVSECGCYTRELNEYFDDVPPTSLTPAEPAALNGDAAARKAAPMFEGLVAYFPNALAYVSHVSKKGNDQHNPGLPMQWSFDKSTDEKDCLARHLAEAGTLDTDGLRHSGKVAWRALANLERELLASDPTLKPGANVRGYK